MRSGITRRWLRGSLLITVLLVLLVEVMFLYSATRSYYEKGAARPFQTPKKKSKRKKASRFAKRFFLVSPIWSRYATGTR